MRIAIVGSRAFKNLGLVEQYVAGLPIGSEVVSGGACGVDRCAETAAIAKGLKTTIFKALWSVNGKRAGYLRNRQIVDYADKVVAFWDGQSKGTKHTIDIAVAEGKLHEVIGYA